ncbi:MAG TPA: flavin reductase family protein [Tepidisphaeraceae bacterium]|nr:flavin reductase family protein [Tepidisphaeraceae bacterium]
MFSGGPQGCVHMTDDQKSQIAKPLGRVPSGVYILTARHNDHTAAIMASWVQQASFDPPSLSIALAKGRPIGEMIRASNRLAISILPSDDKTLMKYYARLKPDEDAFQGVSIRPAPSGIPILLDSLGYLDCELSGVHDFGGDHDLFIAKITAGEMLREGTAFAHQRGSGFHY